ncbi:MAG: 4Fe-4S binding protein [Desulfobacteraceae bacterium]|uniref:4Fe-4S binding protein n=1 Tax=Candidatus Desulfacyla euxinica TaxID=2841693 RepID=A0A8J6MYZ0_9DELT|nr:4Fe-4S binding protein [Candidatus Desulfacyla euxinica]MBL6977696.1 4Fe-4S binding protein [Desulfobacteraceae bacterium]
MKKPSIKTWRRALQIGVAVAFILIPLLNHFRINYFTGNFLAFYAAGLPLVDPLAVLQITLKNYYLSVDLLVGAGIALGLAAALGTVFCSWVCPFGLLSEWGQSLSGRLLPRADKGMSVKGRGFRIKIILFGLGLAGFLLFSTTPVLNQLSLPAWYSRIFQFYFEQRHISLAILFLLAILLVEFAARQRLWCRYICPQSFLLIAAKLINPSRLKIGFQQDKCLSNKAMSPCQKACSLSLDPKTLGESVDTECTNCGDCVVACKRMGRALGFQFGLRYRNSD